MQSAALWSQLARGETASSYAWFLRYRDLGPKRTLEALTLGVDLPNQTSTKPVPDSVPLSLSRLKALSSKYRWVERAEAWDRHLSEIRDQVIERNAEKRAERELTRADELFETYLKMRLKGMQALDWPLAEVTVVDDEGRPSKVFKPMRWGMKDIPALLKAAFELRDEATKNPAAPAPTFEEQGAPRRPLVFRVEEARRDPDPMPIEVEEVRREDPPAEIPNVEGDDPSNQWLRN